MNRALMSAETWKRSLYIGSSLSLSLDLWRRENRAERAERKSENLLRCAKVKTARRERSGEGKSKYSGQTVIRGEKRVRPP